MMQKLAGVCQRQNAVFKSLCSAIDKLHKALQKLED
jgi:hypothetical protein